MEQMNTGMPPAGEAGMLLYNPGHSERLDFKYSRGDGTFCCGSNCAKTAASYIGGVGNWEAPATHWRWATLAELTAAGINEDEARKMVHKSMLTAEDKPAAAAATAPKNASIPADYIAWDGKAPHPNLPAGTSIRYMLRGGSFGSTQLHGVAWGHTGGPGDVIAYRPLHDGDARMLRRDMAEHKPRPIAVARVDDAASRKAMLEAGQRYLRGMRDEAVSAAAWVERPFDHRLGNFN